MGLDMYRFGGGGRIIVSIENVGNVLKYLCLVADNIIIITCISDIIIHLLYYYCCCLSVYLFNQPNIK